MDASKVVKGQDDATAALLNVSLEQRTVTGLLKRAVQNASDNIFIRNHDSRETYAEFDVKTNRVAHSLRQLGVGKGSKVALMLTNSPEFLYGWFAVAKLGGIYVPINTEYKGDVLQHQLNKSEVTHVIVDDELVERLVGVEQELEHLTTVVFVDRGVPAATLGDAITSVPFENLFEGEASALEDVCLYTDSHAISFTSGTTGLSKGVLATHCHIVSFALDWIKACGFTSEDKLYSCLPMFHAISSWLGLLPALICQTEYCFARRFSASGFWDDVRYFNATVVHGIFAMVPMLLKQPERPDDADVPARVFYIGQRNGEFETRFNCRIVEVYGATETGIVTYTPLTEEPAAGSCGKANTETYEVALVDDNDNPVPVGEVGEIVVRPRQPYSMIKAYYNMPQESLDAFKNFWFHTGDFGKQDSDGFYFFVDRKKDALRRRGENISSFELERVLNSSDSVAECAAIAKPSELGEDEVKMVVVPRDGVESGNAELATELWRLCEERMPRFWVPRYLEFRDSLPKTPNGKVRKIALREGQDAGVEFDREQLS